MSVLQANHGSSSAEGRRAGAVAVLAVAAIVAVLLVFTGIHILNQLDSMAANLTTVNASLGGLKTTNHKLDALQNMSAALREMSQKLSHTDQSLDEANRSLTSMVANPRVRADRLTTCAASSPICKAAYRSCSVRFPGLFCSAA